jgi:hypothetical protein
MARLDTEGKIQTLQEKRAKNVLDAAFLGGNDALTAREKQLEIEKQILDLQKQQQDEARSAAEQVASLSRSLADAVRAEAETDKANSRAAMTDEQKIADLKKEQAELMRQAADSLKAGQHLDAIEKRTEAKRIGGEIAALERSGKPVIPTIIADDMRKIGGGGLAAAFVCLAWMIVTQRAMRTCLASCLKAAERARLKALRQKERRALIDGGPVLLKHRWKLWR